MLTWIIYVTVVSLLLGAAALAAEQRARLRRASSRWFWILAIVASLLIPTVIASVSVQLPSIFSPAVSQKMIALREVTSTSLSPLTWLGGSTARIMEWRSMDSLLQRSWLVVSILMLIALAASGAHLFWRKRRWAKGTVAGTSVYIATDIGPAVVGLIHPCIVVPTWLTLAPAAQQAAVLAHEQSHLDAGDQRLLTVALCLLVFMPWNLPLWWQLRRLRYAIEVDCDARVLKAGHDVTNYGETLIAVGQRQSGYIGAVAAMSESKSFLEKRIQIMMQKPARSWHVLAAALGCVSLGLVAVAAQVSPPNAGDTGNNEMQQISVPETTLEGYTGYYRFGENAVLTVTRKVQQLSAQLTGQPAAEIYPQTNTTFFYKVVKATIDFIPDEQGRATTLILHQNGRNTTALRIDEATAEQIKVVITSKIQSQSPTPGSEAALRRLIAGQIAGNPNYAEMSPELANAVREQLPKMKGLIAQLGALQSLEFRGVGTQGWDIYDARYEHGTVQYRIALSSTGIITGALMTAGP